MIALWNRMHRLLTTLAIFSLILSGLFVAPSMARAAAPTEVTVTPTNPNGWAPANIRTGGSVELSCANPRNGDGSIEFNNLSGSAKADYANYWGVIAGRTLGNLSAFSYEWFRDSSSTNPDVQAPALRLAYLTAANESGYLIYEPVYNDYPGGAPTDTWVASNAISGNFWMRAFGPGRTIDDYNVSLAEWLANADEEGSPIDDDADTDVPHVLSPSTNIVGIEVGVGSGWNGVFEGYADSVRIGFGPNDDTIWNFEGDCAPPTGSLKITKVVELDGLTPPEPGDLFEICISGPSYPSGDCKAIGVAGGDLIWTNLEPGSYSFTENAPGTEWSASYSPTNQQVSVTAGQEATATVTNKLCCLYATDITLQTTSEGVSGQVAVVYSDGYVPANVEVTVRWTLPDNSTVEQTEKTNASGVASFSLPSSQSGQFKLEVIKISDAPNGATVFCPERGVVRKTINRASTGRLVVTKRVNWDGFAPKAASFEICISGPSYPNGNEPGACKSVSVTGNEGTDVVVLTATWMNLTPGAYTVTETDPGFSWIVTGNGATVQVAAGQTARTTIVNKFCSLISKRIAMNVNARGDVIARVYIEFTDGYNAFVTDVEAEWTLPDGSTLPVRVQTNGSGMAEFRLSNPPAGTYTITVLNVDWPGEQLNLNKGVRVKSITKS